MAITSPTEQHPLLCHQERLLSSHIYLQKILHLSKSSHYLMSDGIDDVHLAHVVDPTARLLLMDLLMNRAAKGSVLSLTLHNSPKLRGSDSELPLLKPSFAPW